MADLLDGLFRFTGASEIPIVDSANPTRVQSDDDRGRSGILKLVGTLTATRELILPYYVGSWEVRNTTAQTVTVRGETGATVSIPTNSNGHIFCDGLGFYLTSGSGGGSGVTDHGALTGLSDNDHPQYQLAASALGLTSATPQPVGTAAVGNGTSAARDNHVHAHGDQLGGTLHAGATTSNPGFMSAADKAKLDGLSAGAPTTRQVIAGAGLTGGGDLSADRTINVVAGDSSIVVSADSIAVGVISDAQHGTRAGGTTHPEVTGSTAGYMSPSDKSKLDGIPAGGTAIPQPTGANQVYNSSAANTAAWTDDPTVDTIKALTSIDIGTYLATAASGAGEDCKIIAQAGAANNVGGFALVAGGAGGVNSWSGGAGLSSKGDTGGFISGYLGLAVEEVGVGRRVTTINVGVRATSSMAPTGDLVTVIGPAATIPTSAPTATNHAGLYVGNVSGGAGKVTHVCGGGVTYQAIEVITVASETIGLVVLGQLINGGQTGGTSNQVRRGTATGRINVVQLQPGSSWTGQGGSSNYAKYLGFTATLYWSGSVVIPCLDLCPLDGTPLVGDPPKVYLEMDASNNVLLRVQNEGAPQCEFVVSWDWNQRF